MVVKKRVDYGPHGLLVSHIPKAPRSIRRRGSFKNKVEDDQICAFELLAAVAGKLLQETESSSASSNDTDLKDQLVSVKDAIKQEQQNVDRLLKTESLARGSCDESVTLSAFASEKHNVHTYKELPHVESDTVLERTSIISSSDCSENVETALKLMIPKGRDLSGICINKVEGGSSRFGESCGITKGSGIGKLLETGGEVGTEVLTSTNNTCRVVDPIGLFDSKVELPCKDDTPNYFLSNSNNVKIGGRDDDENSFRSNPHFTKVKTYRPTSRMGNSRIRKLLTYKYWKVAPKLKDYDSSNIDRRSKPVGQSRKTYYGRDSRQYDTPYKKRKLFDQSSVVTSDGRFGFKSFSNSHLKVKGEKKGSDVMLHKANAPSASVKCHSSSFHPMDSHVRLSIKSLRVPELFIEVPETATVGSLKRKVLEAVTAVLSSELHVGVLLRGKKVKDDSRTLLQSGISEINNMDTLGFLLEPSSTQATSPMRHEDAPFLLPCDIKQQLIRSPVSQLLDSGVSDASSDPSPPTSLDNHVENNHDIVPTASDYVTNETSALIPIPALNAEALAMVPMSQKTRRSELAQRRIRRPFSVTEVEALVHAVEELGTGRWRDVKLRSFDTANHRTYVDLKDKWKTLVHTAQISPQQRRGQPVPQELLDRVLAAHSYWSQHQAKQQCKHQTGTLKLMEAHTD